MNNVAQTIDRRLDWSVIPEIMRYMVEQAIAIQQIPAPTFHEQARAAYVMGQFQTLNLSEINVDDVQNVYGLLPGQQSELPAVMVSAHTDTVFPAETDLQLRYEEDLIYGPGLGDNSIGVAGMLGLLAAIKRWQIQLDRDIWFVATTGEEGLGDLRGMKAAYNRLAGRLGKVINLEGLAFGHVYHAGIAVRRLHIVAKTGGGHSWLHFGRPSATHAIIELGARILSIQPPQSPRTTYNIGQLEGGQGINVIATEAGLWLDMRSESYPALRDLEQQVRAQIHTLTTPELCFDVNIVGDRPAGVLSPNHELVQAALNVLLLLGVEGVLENGSTDANIPLAEGCPAVTIGITRGGNAHRTDEFIERQPIELGLRQLILLTLAAAGY
jgi:acetylornithine deacetylase/succinyl-diaminopimelate desuccinylase-like protein